MSIIDSIKRLFGGSNHVEEQAMIPCEEALALVNEFIDGELEGVPHDQVKAHFDVCQRCYPHLKLEGAFREAVRRASEHTEAPANLRTNVLQAIAEAEG